MADPIVVDRHPDPLGAFQAVSLVAAKHGWWLADVDHSLSGKVAPPASRGRVVELDTSGLPQASVVVSERKIGASVVRIAPHGAGVRGVFVEDRGKQRLRTFDVGCGEVSADSRSGHW